MESKKKNGSVLCSRMLPFFQNPLGRKIMVPRADHAIRWAMQPGAPASRNRASAASSSTHPRPLCGLPEKGSPFLRLIPLPPFCCTGPCYARPAVIVQCAGLWYNKTLRDTLYRENDLYADHYTAGHCGYHATARPGTPGGATPANKSKAVTACSSMLITDTDPILWMNAAEIAFLRSEYELRWGSAVSAQSFYEQGIRLSFEERGVAGAEDYIADEANVPEAYTDPLGVIENNTALPQSRITIKWKEDAQFEENLERIITQKWIAIFPLGNEAWAEYRRTGYPKLMPAKDNKSGGTVNSKYGMRRLPYPSEEYSENRTNVEAAITSLGGPDNGGTRTWWDCKPLN